MEQTSSKRLIWIDYMKVIGMYLIVAGHFFSIGNKYIYTFSVALFFCISGFLCKKEEDHRFFWKKLWYNLIIPMILICTISFAWKTQSEIRHNIFNCENLYMFPILLISGFHKVLGPMWFVYTLCILKIVFQFLPSKWLYTFAFFSPFITIATNECIYNTFEPTTSMGEYANAITNTTIAYPFFMLGNYNKKWKKQLNECTLSYRSCFFAIISLSILYGCGTYNDIVFMYLNGFGSNYILFFLGSITGTIYILSKWLSQLKSKHIYTLSTGSIAILGFHMIPITYIRSIFVISSWKDYIIAMTIMLLFIPIINFIENYIPILIGKYRIR